MTLTLWLFTALLVSLAMLAARMAVRGSRRGRAAARLHRATAAPATWLPPAPGWLEARLADAAVGVDPRVVAAVWSAAVVCVPCAGVVAAGPGLAVAALVGLSVGPLLVLRLARGRVTLQVERQLPDALEGMARTLRTGGSLRQAVAEAAVAAASPLSGDLAELATRIEHGVPLAIAAEQWAGRRPLPGVRLAAAAVALGAEMGGAQARAIDGVAITVRERLAARAEVRAQATQARMSAAVIALAPLVFSALASATDPRTARFLFHTSGGFVLLFCGLALDGAGAFWMARITREAV